MITLIAAATLASLDPATAKQVINWSRKAKPFTSCTIGPDCAVKWEAAKNWVRENTRFKIIVDEPGLFSTPGAIYANTDLSFTLTWQELGDGQSELKIYAWCGNVISCIPKPKTAVEQLKRVVDQASSTSRIGSMTPP